MEWAAWVADYGALGLTLVAFLGATLLPVSSEVAVVAALQLGMSAGEVLFFASLGNALGASFNYGLGWVAHAWVAQRQEASRSGRRALAWSQRYGRWSLLGSWLPLVGDPLCLAAGLIRVRLPFFVAVGIGTRVARYGVLVYLF